jgi:hypothetical protein
VLHFFFFLENLDRHSEMLCYVSEHCWRSLKVSFSPLYLWIEFCYPSVEQSVKPMSFLFDFQTLQIHELKWILLPQISLIQEEKKVAWLNSKSVSFRIRTIHLSV